MKRIPLFALLTANAISMVGNILAMVAIPWFVLETTGSASKTGITAFFTAMPAVIAAFFGGAIVDRLGFKRTSVIADIASGITVAMVPLLYLTTGLAFWQLLVLVFLGALLDAPGVTARQALLPDVAEMAGTRLERANAAYQAIQRSSILLGPPLAGLLIAVLGPANVLWVDAATFAISAALIALSTPSGRAAVRAANRYWHDLAEGLRFIRRDRLILSIVITVAITNFLDSPLFAVLMPVYANENFGSAVDLGLIFASFGAGSTVSAIIFAAIGHHLPRRATFIGAFILVGLPFWLLAQMPSLPLTIAAMLFSGFAAGPINPVLMTVSQERIPAGLRGRVFGMTAAMAAAAAPLGMVAAGYLAEGIGLTATLTGLAAAYLIVTVGMLFTPAFHEMDVGVSARLPPSAETEVGEEGAA